MNVLVTAASKEGSTTEIAEAIAQTLRRRALETTVSSPERVGDVRGYDAFVIGSAVYMGHWLEPASDLVRRLGPAVSERPVWLFSSGPVGDPTRKLVQRMGADPIELPALLAQTKARDHRMFAGKLVKGKEHLSRPQRISLSIFRSFQGDFRDWTEINRWASQIADCLAGRGDHKDAEPLSQRVALSTSFPHEIRREER
jgi:menaquinone-dependent protoporphyrinogen oxidase